METLLRAKDFAATPVEADVRALLSGLLVADWRQALIARGLGWHVDVGAFSTPIVGGGAGTVIDLDQPELGISIGAGWVLVPLRIHVVCQTPLIAADNEESEILLAVDRTAEYARDGTVVSEVPTCLRTSTVGGCPATVFSAATADITDPVLGIELAHSVKAADFQGTPATAFWGDLSLLYEPRHPPFIVGPAALYGYFGGTAAVSGFINADFLVFSSTLIIGLV